MKSSYFIIIAIIIAILIAVVAIALLTPEPKALEAPEPKALEEQEVIEEEVIVEPSELHTEIITDNPTVCEFPKLQVVFTDEDGNGVDHVNYDIVVFQNDDLILMESEVHYHSNVNSTHTGDVLLGVFPMEIDIITQAIGHAPLPEPILNATSFTVIPQTLINVDCELLHETEDELPQ